VPIGLRSRLNALLRATVERHATLAGLVAGVRRWLEDIDPALSEDAGRRARAALRLLQPFAADGLSKVRLGRPFDGGYVVLDDLDGVSAALSLGVGPDVSWDLEMAARGKFVYQYDHTVDSYRPASDLFIFRKRRVGAVDDDARVSLDTVLKECMGDGHTDLILKMDIESDEWAVLDAVDSRLLQHCRQLVCEFHDLSKLAEVGFSELAHRCFEKLSDTFFVCHVHGNNWGGMRNVGNVVFPDVLEITFANRRRYEPRDIAEIFPTALDMPNREGHPDCFLGTFRF
jgi:hypothetical protein